MKVVLVLPDQTKLDELNGWWYPPPSKRKGKPRLPSLGMLYLCSAIESDHEVIYIDNSTHKLSDDKLVECILAHAPQVAGFGGTMLEWPQASTAAAMLKSIQPQIITLYGGPNATVRPEKHIRYFDYVFRGMAEASLKEFLERLERGQALEGVAGLCAKSFKTMAPPASIQDLDTIPRPARHKINLNHYRRDFIKLTFPTDVVVASRGCPFDCRFCSSQYIWGRRYIARSTDQVIEEIKYIKQTYGTRSIHFREDNLTVNRDRLTALCEKMAQLGLEWTCQSRINSLNESVVKMMKDAGCRLISCGFESINDSTLQYMRKRQTARQVVDTIELFEKVGMHYTGGFIVATPNETRQEILNTIRFAQQAARLPYSCMDGTVGRFVGIPISEMYEQIIRDGLVEYNWQDGEMLFPRTYQMSSEAVDELIRQAYGSAGAAGSPQPAAADGNPKTSVMRPKPAPKTAITRYSIDEGQLASVENLAEKATVVIRSVGERTEGLCYDRLRCQIPEHNIHLIHETPFSQALRKTFQIGLQDNRPWLFVVDADVLVMPRIVDKMIAYAETLDEKVFCVIGMIIDKFLQSPREGGVHLYRTKWLRQAVSIVPDPYQAIRPENFVIRTMNRNNFRLVRTDVLTGLHDFEQFYRDIYRKGFIHAIKNNEMVLEVLDLWRKKAAADPDYQVALAGYEAGRQYGGRTSIDANAAFMDSFEESLRSLGLSEKLPLTEKRVLAQTESSESDTHKMPCSVPGPKSTVSSSADKNGDRILARADASMERGDWAEAIRLYQDVIAIRGEHTPCEVYHRLNEAYRKQAAFPEGSVQQERQSGSVDKHHILAMLHQHLKPEFYLEIGVQRGRSLALAQCAAVGIDPMPDVQTPLSANTTLMTVTSDAFFKDQAPSVLKQAPDLVFIDGMHLFEYALRDFMHVERYSAPWTLAVIDDIFPNHPAQAERRRRTRTWTGDVWKLYEILKRYRPDLFLLPLDASPTGLLLVGGLDSNNRSLQHQYDSIVKHYVSDESPPDDILHRRDVRSDTKDTVLRCLSVWRHCRRKSITSREVADALRDAVSKGTWIPAESVNTAHEVAPLTTCQDHHNHKTAPDFLSCRDTSCGRVMVYTAISDDYDVLHRPQVVSEHCDYVCFTDNPNLTSDVWKIRPFPALMDDPVRTAKLPKLLPHLLFADYEISVWVDSNLAICGDVGRLARQLLTDHYLALFRHPENRRSVFDEVKACIQLGKDDPDTMIRQVRHYVSEGFSGRAAPACGILFRRHHNPLLIRAMQEWWQQVNRFSRRDQLSFEYIAERHKLKYLVIDEDIRRNGCFLWNKHSRSGRAIKQRTREAQSKSDSKACSPEGHAINEMSVI